MSIEDSRELALAHIGPDSQVSNEGVNRVANHYHTSAATIESQRKQLAAFAEDDDDRQSRNELKLELAAKNNEIASLKEEVKEKDMELVAVTTKQAANEETVARVEHREGHLRVGEKAPLLTCELVDGLQFKEDMTFGSLMNILKSADSRLVLNRQRSRQVAVRDVDSFMGSSYAHQELRPLLIALINEEHVLKFEVLARLNELRKAKKEVGDKEVHVNRPAPLTLSSEIVPDILDKVFHNDNNDAFFCKLQEWASDYGSKYPNVSPTKKQQRYKNTPSGTTPTYRRSARTPTRESTPSSLKRNRQRSATPTLLPEPSKDAPPNALFTSLCSPRNERTSKRRRFR